MPAVAAERLWGPQCRHSIGRGGSLRRVWDGASLEVFKIRLDFPPLPKCEPSSTGSRPTENGLVRPTAPQTRPASHGRPESVDLSARTASRATKPALAPLGLTSVHWGSADANAVPRWAALQRLLPVTIPWRVHAEWRQAIVRISRRPWSGPTAVELTLPTASDPRSPAIASKAAGARP
jgi:hypothetical protein